MSLPPGLGLMARKLSGLTCLQFLERLVMFLCSFMAATALT